MSCCGGAKWKREEVADHKFDFVDTREFTDNGFMMRMKYLWLYIIVLKSFLVYISDISTAITMLTTTPWTKEIFDKCEQIEECISIKFDVTKYLFLGCIIFSFLLLAYESRKAKKIIASRDISFAFTNVLANNYYSLRSYDHFCFFDHISNSTKTSDDFAFFVFFTFKSWKRLLLADGPRQAINALTLYAMFLSRRGDGRDWWDVPRYFAGNSLSTSALTISTFFTVTVFAGSLLLLIVAGICYVPLLMHIRGNLKEYCCHKVDKRIDDVIKRRNQQRLKEASKQAQREAMGDYSHLKNKKGEVVKPLPQPTLPNLSVDDDFDDASSMHTRVAPPSTYTRQNNDYYYADKANAEYPPMPAYNQYSQQYGGAYGQYNPSQATLAQDSSPYIVDDADSTAHLSTSAAPMAYSQNHAGYDSSDAYYRRAASTPANDPSAYQRSEGLAYEYPSPNPSVQYDQRQDYGAYNAATPHAQSRHHYGQSGGQGYDGYARGI
ncbi:hypothetical protein EYR40_005398 [Pleurotus pulmonarius]|nr:hypothetical protein EYR40_005398 [Pleurotus pulmonarius]